MDNPRVWPMAMRTAGRDCLSGHCSGLVSDDDRDGGCDDGDGWMPRPDLLAARYGRDRADDCEPGASRPSRSPLDREPL